MSRVKCIALDLDGTTLNSSGELSIRTEAALLKAASQGIEIIVASGRSLASLPVCIRRIPGIRYAVTSNRAAVYDLLSGELLRAYRMTAESVEAVLAVTERALMVGTWASGESVPLAYESFIEGVPYAQASYVADPVRYGAAERAISYIQRTRRPVEDIRAFIRKHKERLDCIDVVIPEGEEKQRLWKVLEKEVEDIYITSSVPQLLEIAYKEAGKAPAVQFLLERLGISRCELAAFGDGDNDCALLEYAGLGIAVENACKSCLAAADRVTASNDKDGVAIEIEKFLEG